jgi:hypothetical protein
VAGSAKELGTRAFVAATAPMHIVNDAYEALARAQRDRRVDSKINEYNTRTTLKTLTLHEATVWIDRIGMKVSTSKIWLGQRQITSSKP